jgi:hypothetical protein
MNNSTRVSTGLDEQVDGLDRGHAASGDSVDQSFVVDVRLGAVGAQVVDELVKLFRVDQFERSRERRVDIFVLRRLFEYLVEFFLAARSEDVKTFFI